MDDAALGHCCGGTFPATTEFLAFQLGLLRVHGRRQPSGTDWGHESTLKATLVEREADRMGKDDRVVDGKSIGEMIAGRSH